MQNDMKRMVMLTALLLMILSAQAQDARVAEIRRLYAEVKENMEYRKKAEIPPNDMVVTLNYMAPGAGPIKDVTHYFYDGEFKEDAGNVVYCPIFITRKYNVGAAEYYEEYLFDEGSLVFYFCKQLDNETRYYWGINGFMHEVIKGERLTGDTAAADLASDMKIAFDKLINRNN